jgi:hypothetical protein
MTQKISDFIVDVATRTLSLPNAEAWREIMCRLDGRVPKTAMNEIRDQVWAYRRRLAKR